MEKLYTNDKKKLNRVIELTVKSFFLITTN